jgi:hypothetical protein
VATRTSLARNLSHKKVNVDSTKVTYDRIDARVFRNKDLTALMLKNRLNLAVFNRTIQKYLNRLGWRKKQNIANLSQNRKGYLC